MTGFSGILLTALQETLDEALKYAESIGETYGEIAIDVRTISREPTKRLKRCFEGTLYACPSQVGEERHEVLARFIRDAHSKELKGEGVPKTGWRNSDIAHDRCVMCSPENRDYSIMIAVLFESNAKNQEICHYVTERIGYLVN